jgi:hypothetical protein
MKVDETNLERRKTLHFDKRSPTSKGRKETSPRAGHNNEARSVSARAEIMLCPPFLAPWHRQQPRALCVMANVRNEEAISFEPWMVHGKEAALFQRLRA